MHALSSTATIIYVSYRVQFLVLPQPLAKDNIPLLGFATVMSHQAVCVRGGHYECTQYKLNDSRKN